MQLLQISKLHIYDSNPSFHHIPKLVTVDEVLVQ